MTEFVVRHPRTKMFIAEKTERNPRFGHRCGFGQVYKWVRDHGEASRFTCYADAELPGAFLDLAAVEICPLLSCGLVGDPITRERAMLDDTFHSRRGAKEETNGYRS